MREKPSSERARSPIRGRLLVPGAGVLSALVPGYVAFNSALDVQVLGAGAGALAFTAGVAVSRLGWPNWQRSEVHRLGVASGFLLCCLGAFAMAAGVGLYH